VTCVTRACPASTISARSGRASWPIFPSWPVRGSSVGRSLVWEEEGGGPAKPGKFVADYQLARGVKLPEHPPLNSAPAGGGALQDPGAPSVGTSVEPTPAGHRAARGSDRAVHPTDSNVVGDREATPSPSNCDPADGASNRLRSHRRGYAGHSLHARQRRVEKPERANLSGRDRPNLDRDSKGVLERLRAFAAAAARLFSSAARRRWWSVGLS